MRFLPPPASSPPSPLFDATSSTGRYTDAKLDSPLNKLAAHDSGESGLSPSSRATVRAGFCLFSSTRPGESIPVGRKRWIVIP